MADISNELIYEVLKQVQDRLNGVDRKIDELRGEMQAFRGHIVALRQYVHNIYSTLAHQGVRIDRIERRLELVEPLPTR